MQMVESQLEIFHVPEPVGLSLESFDLVVGPLYDGTGYAMYKEVEESCPVAGQGLGYSGKDADTGVHGVFEPDIQEAFGTYNIFFLPKESELLFDGMSKEKGLIGLKESIEADLSIGIERVVVSKQEETIALEGLLPELIELLLLPSSNLIHSLVHESRYMVVIKDDIDSRQPLAHRRIVASAHVHGHRLKLFCLPGEFSEEGAEILFAFAFHGMQDSTALYVDKDGHVFMALSQTEFIDSNVFQFVQRDGPVKRTEFVFVNIFHQIPSHSEELGDRADGAKLQKIQNSQCKGADISVLAIHEGQSGPPEMIAPPTFEPVEQKIQKASLSSQRTHPQESSFLSFKDSLSATALGTLYKLVGHPGIDRDAVSQIVGRFIVDTPYPKSMVEYRRGHGLISPPVVRWRSNN